MGQDCKGYVEAKESCDFHDFNQFGNKLELTVISEVLVFSFVVTTVVVFT